jgi:hypothetical protein
MLSCGRVKFYVTSLTLAHSEAPWLDTNELGVPHTPRAVLP